jgi:hypothetical protein
MEKGVCVLERVVSDTKPDIKSIQDTVSELNSGGKKVTDLKDGLKEKWTGAFAKYIIGKLNKPTDVTKVVDAFSVVYVPYGTGTRSGSADANLKNLVSEINNDAPESQKISTIRNIIDLMKLK